MQDPSVVMAYGSLLEELVKTVPDGVASWRNLFQMQSCHRLRAFGFNSFLPAACGQEVLELTIS